MKKLIYTLSFVAFLSICGTAQTDKPASKQEPAKMHKEAVNHDPATPAKTDAPATEPKGTRMAINEKGVPANKAVKEKSVKEDKPASPGQPATEKK